MKITMKHRQALLTLGLTTGDWIDIRLALEDYAKKYAKLAETGINGAECKKIADSNTALEKRISHLTTPLYLEDVCTELQPLATLDPGTSFTEPCELPN